jgi:hypothetical protein
LFEQTYLIIDGVKNIGGEIAIICDGNRVNQNFETYSDKPWRTKDNIFLLFDYVHLLKNIRNNWSTEKNHRSWFILTMVNKRSQSGMTLNSACDGERQPGENVKTV